MENGKRVHTKTQRHKAELGFRGSEGSGGSKLIQDDKVSANFGFRIADWGGPKTEDGRRKSEGGGRRAEVGGRRSEVEVGGRGRRSRTEVEDEHDGGWRNPG